MGVKQLGEGPLSHKSPDSGDLDWRSSVLTGREVILETSTWHTSGPASCGGSRGRGRRRGGLNPRLLKEAPIHLASWGP